MLKKELLIFIASIKINLYKVSRHFKKVILAFLTLAILVPLLHQPALAEDSPSATQNNTEKSCPEEGVEGIDFLLFKGPLVPCGIKKETECQTSSGNEIHNTCTLCHLFILIDNLMRLMTSLLIIVALTVITLAGIAYTVSSGNANLKTAAKKLITKTLIGFGLFLMAWLIIHTVLKIVSYKETNKNWWEIECDDESMFDKGVTSTDENNPANTTPTGSENDNTTAQPNPNSDQDNDQPSGNSQDNQADDNKPSTDDSGKESSNWKDEKYGSQAIKRKVEKNPPQEELVAMDVPCKDNCKLTRSAAGKIENAYQNDNKKDWQVTEAFPPTTARHKNSCHYNATCVDVNFKDRNPSKDDVERLSKHFSDNGLRPVYETHRGGCKGMSAEVDCKEIGHITAPHFSVYAS